MASGIDIFNQTYTQSDFGGQGGSIGAALGRGAKQNRLYEEKQAKAKKLFETLAKARQLQEQYASPERYVYGQAEKDEEELTKAYNERQATTKKRNESLQATPERIAKIRKEVLATMNPGDYITAQAAEEAAMFNRPMTTVTVGDSNDDLDFEAEEASLDAITNQKPIFETELETRMVKALDEDRNKAMQKGIDSDNSWFKKQMGVVKTGIDERTEEMKNFNINQDAPGFKNQSLSQIGQYSPKTGLELMYPKASKTRGVTGNAVLKQAASKAQAALKPGVDNALVALSKIDPDLSPDKHAKALALVDKRIQAFNEAADATTSWWGQRGETNVEQLRGIAKEKRSIADDKRKDAAIVTELSQYAQGIRGKVNTYVDQAAALVKSTGVMSQVEAIEKYTRASDRPAVRKEAKAGNNAAQRSLVVALNKLLEPSSAVMQGEADASSAQGMGGLISKGADVVKELLDTNGNVVKVLSTTLSKTDVENVLGIIDELSAATRASVSGRIAKMDTELNKKIKYLDPNARRRVSLANVIGYTYSKATKHKKEETETAKQKQRRLDLAEEKQYIAEKAAKKAAKKAAAKAKAKADNWMEGDL